MDPLSLIHFILQLNYEKLWVLYTLPMTISLVLVLTVTSMRRLRKMCKVLSSKRGRVCLVVLITLINILAKIATIVILTVLLAKPYVYYEREIVISREMKTRYFSEEIMVIMLIDFSHSMKESINGRTKLDLAKEVALKVLEELTDMDKFHIVFFAEELIISSLENTSREYSKIFIKSINETRNYTTIAKALSYAISLYEIIEEPISIIIISDGADNSNVNPIEVAVEASKRGIPVFTIFVGGKRHRNPQLLRSIARVTNSTFLDITKLHEDSLENVIRRFVEDVKYETLSRRIDMRIRVPVRDYKTPMEILLKYLLIFLLVMLLSGV